MYIEELWEFIGDSDFANGMQAPSALIFLEGLQDNYKVKINWKRYKVKGDTQFETYQGNTVVEGPPGTDFRIKVLSELVAITHLKRVTLESNWGSDEYRRENVQVAGILETVLWSDSEDLWASVGTWDFIDVDQSAYDAGLGQSKKRARGKLVVAYGKVSSPVCVRIPHA